MNSLRRPGFTLYQLLVLLALLGLLLGLLAPALARVRRDALRNENANNLRQIVLALHNYADNNATFPTGVDDNGFSAAARLLPYLEQANLYKQIDFKKSVDDKANAAPRKVIVKVFLSPNDPRLSVTDEFGATNYLFNAGTKHALKDNDGPFSLNFKARLPASFPDGTSNTIVVIETLKGDGQARAVDVKRQHVAYKAEALKGLTDKSGVQDFKEGKHIAGNRCASWMDGRFLQGTFNAARRPNDPRPDVNCAGQGGLSGAHSLTDTVSVGLCDGSVHFVNAKKISYETWKAAITPAGGEVLGSDW